MSTGKPSRLEMLSFARYVKSFMPGRVRVRHPALVSPALAKASQERLSAINGVTSVEMNLETGSALIQYDTAVLDQDALMSHGIEWARWLKEQKG